MKFDFLWFDRYVSDIEKAHNNGSIDAQERFGKIGSEYIDYYITSAAAEEYETEVNGDISFSDTYEDTKRYIAQRGCGHGTKSDAEQVSWLLQRCDRLTERVNHYLINSDTERLKNARRYMQNVKDSVDLQKDLIMHVAKELGALPADHNVAQRKEEVKITRESRRNFILKVPTGFAEDQLKKLFDGLIRYEVLEEDNDINIFSAFLIGTSGNKQTTGTEFLKIKKVNGMHSFINSIGSNKNVNDGYVTKDIWQDSSKWFTHKGKKANPSSLKASKDNKHYAEIVGLVKDTLNFK